MRVVLCDDDLLLVSMVESIMVRNGHEVVGVVDSSADAVALIEAARPDFVIADLSLGYNTDFDIVDAAGAIGSTTIVFTHNADEAVLSRYKVRPTVVPKPDVHELERAVARLVISGPQAPLVEHDRRVRPAREATGRAPTGPSDAAAFYEALNAAEASDAVLSIELVDEVSDRTPLVERLRDIMRSTDRVLSTASSVKVLLPGGGAPAISSFLARVEALGDVPGGTAARWVIIEPGESAAAAFDRLKHAQAT